MVDVRPNMVPAEAARQAEPEKLTELTADQLAIEYSLVDHSETGEPFLSIDVRGDNVAALDGEALEGINEAIAVHGHMSMLRATQPSHAIHVEPEYRTDRLKTYDPTLGDSEAPAGDDVVPAHTVKRFDVEAMTVDLVEVPEVRTPYWEFDETVQTNRPDTCPDCTRGLTGDHGEVGDFLRCVQAVLKPDVQPCHAGCVVACGMKPV